MGGGFIECLFSRLETSPDSIQIFTGPRLFFQITPDGDEAMYLSRDTHDPLNARAALYRVRLETPGASLWVADLTNHLDLNVYSFAITPDSSGVVYEEKSQFDPLPDEIPYSNELYRRQFASPDIKTKLNGPLVTFGDVHSFQVR